jgi:hypothetical protein
MEFAEAISKSSRTLLSISAAPGTRNLGDPEIGSVLGMTVKAIKEAIAGLPKDQRHSLATWLNELDYDDWDKTLVKDFSPRGRGYRLVEKVKNDIAGTDVRPMDEGFAARRKSRS